MNKEKLQGLLAEMYTKLSIPPLEKGVRTFAPAFVNAAINYLNALPSNNTFYPNGGEPYCSVSEDNQLQYINAKAFSEAFAKARQDASVECPKDDVVALEVVALDSVSKKWGPAIGASHFDKDKYLEHLEVA